MSWLVILTIGIFGGMYFGIFWTYYWMRKFFKSKRCWGITAGVGYSHRCIKLEGHDGKHYWTDYWKTKQDEW